MKKSLLFMLTISTFSASAQEALSLEQAFQQAIANNHQIKVLENQVEIAENNATIGNAGLLPSVSVGGSYGGNISNTELEFAGNVQPPLIVDNALSSNLNANATVNYVVFSGLSGQRSYQRLKINKLAVDQQSRAAIEATLLQVSAAYYGLARAQDQEQIALENLDVSNARFNRVKLANELGTSVRTELLSARVDMTADSSTYLNAILQRKTSTRNLCRLIGIPYQENLTINPIEIEVADWTEEQLYQQAFENNATLKNLELQSEIAEKNLQLSWSSLFPTISLSGGYSYTNQQNEGSFIASNTSNGWNGSVGISYTLFNGFRNQTNRQNQQLLLESSTYQLEDQKLQLQAELSNAFDAYRQSIRVVNFELSNLESSELNLKRSEDLLKSGQITTTQFREAQVAHSMAQLRISNAKIAVKLNELDILRLTGQILSEE